jgi:peptidyl-Lys metalloendopeptidase
MIVMMSIAFGVPGWAQGQEMDSPGPSMFENCSDDQKVDLSDALSKALSIAGGSRDYLEAVAEAERPFDEAYFAWFGVYNSWRYTKVTANFGKIHSTLETQNVTFSCGCGPDAGVGDVQVDPARPNHIEVCDGFWTRPLSGLNSRSGAVVGAVSRFGGVAGSEELSTNSTIAMKMAEDDPVQAIKNAQSYRYFAEQENKAGVERLLFSIPLLVLLLFGTRMWRGRKNETLRPVGND